MNPPAAADDAVVFYRRWLWLLIVAGLSLRLCVAPCEGFLWDYIVIRDWGRLMDTYGFTGIYEMTEHPINYPPAYLYVLWVLEWAQGRVLPRFELDSGAHQAVQKLPYILADLALALIGAAAARRRHGDRAALLVCGLFCFNPAIWYDSAYWGQTDSVLMLPLTLALLAATSHRYIALGVWGGLALMTKTQALIFMPLLLLAALRRKRTSDLPTALAAGAATVLLILSPFLLAGAGGRVIQKAFLENFDFWPHLSLNAANLWGLHPDPATHDLHAPGWVYDDDGKTGAGNLWLWLLAYKRIGLLLFGAAYVFALVRFWRDTAADAPLTAAVLAAMAFFFLPTEQHERYLYPALPLLTLLLPGRPALRWVYAALSVTFTLNLAVVVEPARLFYPLSLLQLTAGLMVAAALLTAPDAPLPLARWVASPRAYAALLLALVLAPFALWAGAKRGDGGRVYLSDLQPLEQHQDWGRLERDATVHRRPIQLGELRFRKGLGTHAQSTLVYAVPPGATLLETWIGLDATMRANPDAATVASVYFSIEIDGERAWNSELIKLETPPQQLRLPLPAGAARVTLRVHDAEDGINFDQACWAGARFVIARDGG